MALASLSFSQLLKPFLVASNLHRALAVLHKAVNLGKMRSWWQEPALHAAHAQALPFCAPYLRPAQQMVYAAAVMFYHAAHATQICCQRRYNSVGRGQSSAASITYWLFMVELMVCGGYQGSLSSSEENLSRGRIQRRTTRIDWEVFWRICVL